MTLFTDVSQAAIEKALDGVSLRQRVEAQNLANVATPGYRAQKVDFESALQNAISAGDPQNAGLSVGDAGTPDNGNGNTVAMESETAGLMRSSLQYQSLVQAVNYKFDVLRSAIGS